MHLYKRRDGQPAVWYDKAEIETIIEDELDQAGLAPTVDNPVTDVERFLEEHLKAKLDQYATLPPGVLGLTRFRQGGPPTVLINKDLAERADRERRQPAPKVGGGRPSPTRAAATSFCTSGCSRPGWCSASPRTSASNPHRPRWTGASGRPTAAWVLC